MTKSTIQKLLGCGFPVERLTKLQVNYGLYLKKGYAAKVDGIYYRIPTREELEGWICGLLIKGQRLNIWMYRDMISMVVMDNDWNRLTGIHNLSDKSELLDALGLLLCELKGKE